MLRVTKDALRRGLERLLHTHDTPSRTALAYAMGVFWGFSPPLGLHTVLGLACAFAFNLNRVAVLLGIYSNLPWIIVPYYMLSTLAGAAILGAHFHQGLLDQLRAVLENFSISASRRSVTARSAVTAPILVMARPDVRRTIGASAPRRLGDAVKSSS